ncbi:hypothetical protein [Thermotalea metallivorans]|uniref:Uncharacterized protein n=1 Tax=Thermotalea metallivorans TaxID=520762 RepID=A0A140L159_9FIRM|nr:hypothetical protein [Thermotalea metallivorans]KXG74284.1 hypothetical protein AN619_24760 [Thermotalea metallivorans]
MEGNNLVKIENHERGKHPLANMISSLTSGNIWLPIVLFIMLNREGTMKFSSDDLYRAGEILKTARPYFGDKHREVLAKTENIVDIIHSLNRYAKGEYRSEGGFGKSYHNVANKPIKVMEAIRPYMRGKGRENIDKLLTLNDRVNRLRNRDPRNRNIAEDFEYMTDILEILKADKGREVRNVLNKVHKMMEILRK